MYKYFFLLVSVLLFTACTQTITTQETASPTNSPVPTQTQSALPANWKNHTITFNNSTLTFSTPIELQVTSEELKNLTTNTSTGLTLYVQNYKETISETQKPYQLYGIYQWDTAESTEKQFKSIIKDLDNPQESQIAGFPAISGQIKGQRNRFITYILYKSHIFTLATSEPTEGNRLLSESILKTFKFSE